MLHAGSYSDLPDLYLRNGLVVTEETTFTGGLLIQNGRIVQLLYGSPEIAATEVIDVHGQLLMAGLVDAHVHFSEPGREHWEGWATGTQAAAAGGVTTVIEMPLNASPPTIDAPSLLAKQQAAARSAVVDYALWGGLVDNNLAHLEELYNGGVVAFKAFLSESASDFRRIDDDLLLAGLRQAKEFGTLVAVHAENEWVTRFLSSQLRGQGRVDRYAWGKGRPPSAELEAIRRAIFWAEVVGARLHIVHVSQAAGIVVACEAQQRGAQITTETCPHYLLFDEDDFARMGPVAKCAPPLRARAEVEALWDALLAGKIDIIASDHSPCTWAEKAQGDEDIWLAWGGISGLQSTLPALLTEGVYRRGLSLPALTKLVSSNPARLYGLYPRKGTLLPGADADVVIVDPQATYTLAADDLFYKHRHSVYIGYPMRGKVTATYVRGVPVFAEGAICAATGTGQLLTPHASVPQWVSD